MNKYEKKKQDKKNEEIALRSDTKHTENITKREDDALENDKGERVHQLKEIYALCKPEQGV